MLWYLWAGGNKRLDGTQQVEAISKVDWDGYIEDGGLTELHLIVIGFRNRGLEAYIRAHPEELEKKDALGHVPLWYASISGELANIRTLLNYGAILNENTFNFQEFFSISGCKAFEVMEEYLSSDTLKSLFKNGCASDWFRCPNTGRLLDEILAVDKLCLEYDFDVNYGFPNEETLLMKMLQQSYPGLPLRVKQLLDHGADLEVKDSYGKTALHHFIESFGYTNVDRETFNVLVENGARLDYRTGDGTTMLHALILEVVDLKPISMIFHSDICGLPLDAKDSNSYTAFDLLVLRVRLSRQDFDHESWEWEPSLYADCTPSSLWYDTQDILGKCMSRASEPNMERKLLTALEALLHKVQELQGIPPEEQYPSVESVLEQEDKDAEATRLEGLPGSWPE